MPGEFVTKIKKVSDQRFKGFIYPASYGSIAVMGEGDEHLEEVYKEFQILLKKQKLKLFKYTC